MSQGKKAVYTTILGRNPQEGARKSAIVVAVKLPRLGEHDFKWVTAQSIGKEYGHFGFRLHPKANPVNIHVYGDRKVIERLAKIGSPVICEVELVVKKTESDREFILANLYMVAPWSKVSHEFCVAPAPKERPWFVYTTSDMHGVGVSVKPI